MNNNPNFTITAESESKTDYGVEMELEDNVRDLAHLDTDTIIADLERLADKHPEMFKKPSKESSALSKLSSDKVANDLETQLGLPSETIISQKELESQVQNLTHIIKDMASNFPEDTALLVWAYDKCGENALANTLINTISADEKAMQSVQREFEFLIRLDEVKQTQTVEELDEAQLMNLRNLRQGNDNAQMIRKIK